MTSIMTGRRLTGAAVTAALLLALAGCADDDPTVAAAPLAASPDSAERLAVEVLATHPHDPGAFTQGLEWHDGMLYEGTGRHGRSDLRVVEIETGEVVQRVDLPDEFFGEGITVVDDQIWQLTWQEEIAFRRDLATLEEIERVSYSGEGWGICHDRERDRLVMSDGSDQLTFRDPATFEATGSVPVTLDGDPLPQINELECVGDEVWANVWLTDLIVRIDPERGVVTGVVDAAGLLTEAEGQGVDVLNGIAAVPDSDTFLITGKLWPTMFEVRFVPAS